MIRRFADGDFPELLAIVQQPEVARWWDRHDAKRLRSTIQESTFAWTIEVDGRPAGLIIAWEEPDPDSRHVDIDIFLDTELHGQGIGSGALREALRMMFEGRGHHRATLYASPANERAIRVYERIGFKPVGIVRKSMRWTDGVWRDELLMDLLAEEMT
jgi:aminoglycoside 6'-N-acetyltransferase